MSAVKKLDKLDIDTKILRSLVPLNKLAPQQIKELVRKASVIDLARGRTLFSLGDNDSNTYFLLTGDMEFISGDNKIVIKGGSKNAKCALFDARPRPVTAIAKTRVSVMSIDAGFLEIMLSDYNHSNYEVTEIEGGDKRDWMTVFIQSLTDMNLPASNMQALMMRMKQMRAKAGDVVIQQFDHDEYYYIVKEGRCAVSRKASTQGADVRLAELEAGDGFGEEALIANEERSATVRMLEDGILMRLGKNDFLELLVDSVVKLVDFDEALLLQKNAAVFLDVRNVSEHNRDGITNSLNIPLSVLRFKITELDQNKKYIVYCDDEGKSSAAVFLLARAGIESVVLQYGLASVPKVAKVRCKTDDVSAESGYETNAGTSVADVVSLLPYEADLQDGQFQDPGELKKNHKIAENVSDEKRIKEAQLKTEEGRKKANKAIHDKELAEEEAAILRAQIKEVNERLAQRDLESSLAEAELQAKLDEEKQRADKEIYEQKERSRLALRQELEAQLQLAKEQSGNELAALVSDAQSLHAKYLEESRKARSSEASLQKANDELNAVKSENEIVSKNCDVLSKKIEEERSQAEGIEQAHLRALNENEQLKTEINDAQLETKQKIEALLEQNTKDLESERLHIEYVEVERKNAQLENERLKGEIYDSRVEAKEQLDLLLKQNAQKLEIELKEITDTMQDEKNKALAAEKALRKAKELEAQYRAEAEEARVEAENNARKIAQIQDEKIRELEEEVMRAENAEAAQQEAEEMAAILQREADDAKIRADKEAKKYEEAEAARLMAIEKSQRNLEAASNSREIAEKGTSQLRAEIEAARVSVAEALNKSAHAEEARREAQQEIRKQAQIVEDMQRVDEEQERAFMTEQARKKAEEEVGKLKAKLLTQKKAALARQRTKAIAEKKRQEELLRNEVAHNDQRQNELEREYLNSTPSPVGNFAANDSVIIAPEILLGQKETADVKVGSVRKSGWISDALLWETTLGLREDEESEEYLADASDKNKSPKKSKATKHKSAVKKNTPVKKSNPNATVFEAREVGDDPTITNRNIQLQEASSSRRGSSVGKKIIIGSFVSIILVAGAGFYMSMSDDKDQLPGSISDLIDKTKGLGNEVAAAASSGNNDEVVTEDENPLITHNNIKILKQQTELKARKEAENEFAKLKAKASVITKSETRPVTTDTASNTLDSVASEAALISSDTLSATTQSTTTLPATTQSTTTPPATTGASSSVDDGETKNGVNEKGLAEAQAIIDNQIKELNDVFDSEESVVDSTVESAVVSTAKSDAEESSDIDVAIEKSLETSDPKNEE